MTADSTYDHDALLDDAHLEKPPSDHYLTRVKAFDNIVRDCIRVSHGFSGIRSPTSRHYYASVLFTALITRGVSLAQLMPHTPWAKKLIEHWDYSSMAGIARTMMELRIAFYYLCVEPCSHEEWQCRWNLFNLHDCLSRIRLDIEADRPEKSTDLESQADELRNRIRSNAYFQSLEAKTQKVLLKGRLAYLSSLENIAVRAGIERKTFRLLYCLLSSHVHGLPMSYYRIGEEEGRGLPTPVEEHRTGLCLSLGMSVLAHTRDEMQDMFAAFKQDAEEKLQKEAVLETSSDLPIPDNGMAVGETVALPGSEEILIEITRVSEDVFESIYRYRATNDVVLRRTHSKKDGSALTQFDVAFWNVLVDNKPVTVAQLLELGAVRFAFKADHLSRMLKLKVWPQTES